VTVFDTLNMYISRPSAVRTATSKAAGQASAVMPRKEDHLSMTIIRPEAIFCPHCDGEMLNYVGISGNTIGATLWTDGFLDAPMLQPYVRAIRCPHCSKAFFRDDARSSGISREDSLAEGDDAVPGVYDGGLSAYRELLGKTDDRERMHYLRIRIWHAQNDKVRKAHGKALRERRRARFGGASDDTDAAPPLKVEVPVANASFQANLRALLELLGDNPDDTLMRAEIWRELGGFDQALEIARTISDEREWVARQIIALAEAGDAQVAVLARPDEDED